MLYKKALSNIVATVLLILLTIAAVVIIAGFVIPMVRDGLTGGTECFDYRDYFTFEEDFGYNCYNDSFVNRLYGVSVRAGGIDDESEAEIKGFRLSFTSGSESSAVDVDVGRITDSSEDGIRMLDASAVVLEIPKSGEVRTYVFNSSNTFSSVDIVAKLKSGKVCDKSDSITLNRVCTNAMYG